MSTTTTKLPKKNVIFRQCSNSTFVESLLGACVVGSFVVIWISSIISPVLLYLSITLEYHLSTYLILVLIFMAYAPWEKGFISRIINYIIDHYHALYYKRYTMLFETAPQDSNETTKSSKSPTFYAIHPHGAFCLGWSTLSSSSILKHVRFCCSPVLYFSPFFRLFSRLVGKPGKADKSSMVHYMKQAESLALLPGGFEEATLTSTKHDRVYIKKRSGFIKLALIHGYSVVPVYCFGERSTYANIQGFWRGRLALNRLGVPAILIWGRALFPFLPRTVGLYVVAGNPIVLPKIENPTKDEVKVWHDRYIAALVRIFEEHKVEAYGEEGKTAKLELW